MSAARVNPNGAGLVVRVQRWWDTSTYLGDVALLFTLVTVGNSLMMLTGLDEPKTGSFAYVHLLGRLGIIASLVGAFHLGDVRERLAGRRHPLRRTGPADRTRRPARDVLGFFLVGWLDGTARAFTVLVAAVCVVVLALAGPRPPAGGVGLYRNLVLLVVILLPIVLAATRWSRRPRAGGSPPERRHLGHGRRRTGRPAPSSVRPDLSSGSAPRRRRW
jgi:hypothetical protein